MPERNGPLTQRKLAADDVRQLYEQHGGALLAYARSFVSHLNSAEDAVQQVFLKLLHGGTVAPDLPLAYLYRAVRNAALNAGRAGARETLLDGDERWFVYRDGNPEAVLALQTALAELPEEQRTAVMMRIWSGMTLGEVAAATGVPLHTAASRYRYALEKLRQYLKPYRKEQVKDPHG
jgi:RNA polymerase sigma-70 factor, ECF subfamily